MAIARRSISQLRLLVVIIIAISCAASAEPLRSKNVGQLSVPEIEDALQVSQIHRLPLKNCPYPRLEDFKLLTGISNAR